MPGPLPKHPSRRQRRNKPALAVTVSSTVVPLRVPDPPEGLQRDTIASWNAFWRSDQAQLVNWDRDHRSLERLFTLYDLRERCLRSARRRLVVAGSQGQPIANPLLKQLSVIDSEIRQLEGTFGLSPAAAARLGTSMGGLKKTLDDLNRDANDARDDIEDPRLEVAR